MRYERYCDVKKENKFTATYLDVYESLDKAEHSIKEHEEYDSFYKSAFRSPSPTRQLFYNAESSREWWYGCFGDVLQ